MVHGIKTCRLVAAYSLVRGQKLNFYWLSAQVHRGAGGWNQIQRSIYDSYGPDFFIRINELIHYCGFHGLWTPREEIAFAARCTAQNLLPLPVFIYGRSILHLPTSAQFFRYLSSMPSLGSVVRQQKLFNERIILWKNSEFVFVPLCNRA